VAYDGIRDVAETIDKKYPEKSAKEIVDDLQELFPENRMPHPRTVANWRKKDWPPRKATPPVKGPAQTSNQPYQKLLRTHNSRDLAKTIDVYLNHMRRRAQYAPDPPFSLPTLRIHPEPDFYQQAIIATIKQIDPPFAECNRRFDEAVDRGERQVAGEILNQLEKGLMAYTTKLR
jgi:hypothetical protein